MAIRGYDAGDETVRVPVWGDDRTESVPVPTPARDRKHPAAGRFAARGGLRMRILGWYLVLLALSIAIAIVGLRQILVVRLAGDIDGALVQEVEELRLLSTGIDPATGRPFGTDAVAILDTFLLRSLPGEYEAFYTMVDDRPHKRTVAPVSLFDLPEVVSAWEAAEEPIWGRTETTAGPVRWLAAPLAIDGTRSALFAVAYHESEQLAAIDAAVQGMVVMSIAVLLLGSGLAWAAAGRAIAPLRSLTASARGIGDRDLGARIPVDGTDEVAELTHQLNSMLERLEAAFAGQREFLNDVGHELRTPITIVRGHLELLEDDPVERRRTLDLVLDELDRMSRYVSDLLLLARAERPDFLRLEPIELAPFIDGVVSRVSALGQRSWTARVGEADTMVGDPDRLGQALLNLAANAVRHTERDALIEIGARRDGRYVQLWVRDEGTGIALADQERIFSRFARGADAALKAHDGTGLGLAIVDAIAHAHGGAVVLDSIPGHGSTFTVTVPAAPPDERVTA
jgi:two-component system OmpR family sensor kinase